MKTFARFLLGGAILAVLAHAAAAAPLGTGFTYQGQLSQSGVPFNGTAHFRFTLFDAQTGGAQVGSSQVVSGVPVAGGLFTVTLNGAGEFGATAFTGEARWLQVEVCTSPSCASTTTLSPRQALSGTPYALSSSVTRTLTNADGGVVITIQPGTADNSPGMLSGHVPSDLLLGSYVDAGTGYTHSFLSMGYPAGNRKFSIGRASSTTMSTAVFEPMLTVASGTGNIGVGTTAPNAKLDVRGNISLGPNGTEGATSGLETLRIIRGSTFGSLNGTIQSGSGFSLLTEANSIRKITFDTPFSSPPVAVASSIDCSGCFTRFCAVVEVTNTYARIAEYLRSDGSYTGGPISFIIIGPR